MLNLLHIKKKNNQIWLDYYIHLLITTHRIIFKSCKLLSFPQDSGQPETFNLTTYWWAKSLFPRLHGFLWVLVPVQTSKGIFLSFSCIFFTRAQFALKFSLEPYLQGWSRAQAQKRPALQMSKMGHFCHLTFIAACIADSLYLLYIPVVLTIHGLASTQATFIDSTHGTHMLLNLPHKNKKK